MAFPAILGAVLPVVGKVIDNLFPDPQAAAEAKQKMTQTLLENQQELAQAQATVLKAEAESKWALTSTWRPITMLTFTAIVANNYIIAPYINLFFGVDVMLEIPEPMWSLLQIGIGGYIGGRTVEKVIDKWKEK